MHGHVLNVCGTTSYKLPVGISPNLQLRYSWGQDELITFLVKLHKGYLMPEPTAEDHSFPQIHRGGGVTGVGKGKEQKG